MRVFNYKAKDRGGKKLSGEVEANSAQQAARLLRDKGYVPIAISPKRETPFSLLHRARGRITLSDVATFTRQFATMISAGLPVTDALLIIKSQSKGNLTSVVGDILTEVEGGSSLSDAFRKHPRVFSPVYVALIAAGEEGGVLDEVLNRLADNLEKQKEFQSKVKGALIYPTIVVLGMIVVGIIMMVFVIPRLTSLYAEFDAELPTATKVLIGISDFMTNFWWLLLILLFGAAWGLMLFRKTSVGRRRIDEWKLKLPVYGPLHKQVMLAEFTRTLGLLVGVGVSILEALKVVGGVVGNTVISERLEKASKQVEKGFPLAYALSQQPEVFPPLLSQMLSVGEETGKLDEILGKVSHVFELESETTVKGLTAAIEPIIMIILGVGVGFLVIAIIMPIYNLTSQF